LCSGCGRTIDIPSASGAPQVDSPRKSRSRKTFVVLAVCLVACLLCCGGLTALLIPTVASSREAARRTACASNMHQIGMAMMTYEAMHGKFPPAYTIDRNGKPLHSWRVLLLPYLEEMALYNEFELDEPWDSPHNLALARSMPPVYACPGSTDGEGNQTSYAMIVGQDAISDGPNGRRPKDITDGLSSTIMLVEAAGRGFDWTEPVDLDADGISYAINDGSGTGISGNHAEAVNILFCDGSVRALPEDTDPGIIKAMATVAGGESVEKEALEMRPK